MVMATGRDFSTRLREELAKKENPRLGGQRLSDSVVVLEPIVEQFLGRDVFTKVHKHYSITYPSPPGK